MPAEITITTVLYNSADHLRECFRSITPETEAGRAKLVVVDNCSPDESSQIVTEEFPHATLVRAERNLGFSGGCNLALPHLEGRYWLLLNPDTTAPPDGIARLVAWMDAHPEVAAASPEIVERHGSRWYPGRAIPTFSLIALEALRLHRLLPARLRGELLRGNYWQEPGDQIGVDYVPGAVMIVRREVLDVVGPLSETYFMYGEDIEWCWRMRQAGWKIGVCADTTFRHLDGTSGQKTWGDRERRYRILRGWYDVFSVMRGVPYARGLMLANALAYGVEALHPWRSPQRRRAAQTEAQICLKLFRNGHGSNAANHRPEPVLPGKE